MLPPWIQSRLPVVVSGLEHTFYRLPSPPHHFGHTLAPCTSQDTGCTGILGSVSASGDTQTSAPVRVTAAELLKVWPGLCVVAGVPWGIPPLTKWEYCSPFVSIWHFTHSQKSRALKGTAKKHGHIYSSSRKAVDALGLSQFCTRSHDKLEEEPVPDLCFHTRQSPLYKIALMCQTWGWCGVNTLPELILGNLNHKI